VNYSWWVNYAKAFGPIDVTVSEIETILSDAVEENYPDNKIDTFDFREHGVTVLLDNGRTVNVKVDLEELIIQ